MTDAKLRGLRRLSGSAVAFGVACIAAAANPGCGGGTTTTMSTSTGTPESSSSSSSSSGTGGSSSSSGPTSSSASSGGGGTGGGPGCNTGPFADTIAPGANGGFSDAFDATPSPDGTAVFFTGIDMMGNPGVFTQDICTTGATVKAVYTGGAFEMPFHLAISTDGKTLFVADLSAQEDPANPLTSVDKGVLFSLPAAGGTAPTALVKSVTPRGLTVVQENGADVIYFTGIDKANGQPGLFKVPAGGGAVTVIAEGLPFSEPSAVAVTAVGDAYVVDASGAGNTATTTGSHLATLIVVPKAGAAAEFVPNSGLQVGYPAGIALMKDDSKLLISGLTGSANSDALFEVTIATKAVTINSTGIAGFAEAAGLHRAHGADVFAWADTKATPAGMTGTGTVFVIK